MRDWLRGTPDDYGERWFAKGAEKVIIGLYLLFLVFSFIGIWVSARPSKF